MPDVTCTGVPTGVTLHACSSDITVSGQYDSCLFGGQLNILASNVTITRSKVTLRVNAGYGSQTGLQLIDVEIDGGNRDPNGQSGIGDENYTCIRCNVHNTGRGAAIGSNVVIKDSWFHDFYYVNGAHQSAAGSNGGSNNQIIHNNLDCGSGGCSGAFVMYGDFSPINNVLAQNNLFNTSGSYCTYAGSTGTASGKPYPHGTNIRYLDNLFGVRYHPDCGIYGAVTAWENNVGNVWSGNKFTDGRAIMV